MKLRSFVTLVDGVRAKVTPLFDGTLFVDFGDSALVLAPADFKDRVDFDVFVADPIV